MELEKIISAIESILFVSGEPIRKSKIAKILEVSTEEVAGALEKISERYGRAESGLTLLEKGDEVQLASRGENAPFVDKLIKSELQDSLSNAALEVVSIIAYRGPISKSEIEAIRGVNCSYTLRNLLLRGLIERNDNPRDSRGYVYAISFEFLKKLGLSDVKKMPQYDTLSVDQRLQNVVIQEQSEHSENN